MYAVLFEVDKKSLLSIAISLVTDCKYTHSALIIDGDVYDASENRGNVAVAGKVSDWKSRFILVYKIPDHPDAEKYAKEMVGTKYDWKGILGWAFRIPGKNRRFYCFEYVIEVLKRAGIYTKKDVRYDGCDLKKVLAPFLVYMGEARGFNENCS